MSPEERQLLQGLFERIQNAGSAPRDKEAEAFIADAVKALPYAPYLLAQTVIVQDQALRAANDRLQQLEAQVRESRRTCAAAAGRRRADFWAASARCLAARLAGRAGRPRRLAAGWNQPPQQGGWQQSPQQNYGQPGPWARRAPGRAEGGPGGRRRLRRFPQQGGGFLRGALGAAAASPAACCSPIRSSGLFAGHNNSLGIGAGVRASAKRSPGSAARPSSTIIMETTGKASVSRTPTRMPSKMRRTTRSKMPSRTPTRIRTTSKTPRIMVRTILTPATTAATTSDISRFRLKVTTLPWAPAGSGAPAADQSVSSLQLRPSRSTKAIAAAGPQVPAR